MAAATGRVQDFDLAWILLGPMWDINRLFEQLFLREVIASLFGFCRRLFSFIQEYLGGPPHQIPAPVLEGGLALAHLVPYTAEGIVGKELDHVSGSVELIPEGKLVRVARSLAFPSRLVAQFLGREVLVDPSDGLILGPDSRESPVVYQIQHLVQHPLRWVDAVGRIVRIEENADFFRKCPAQPVEEVTIGYILLAGVMEIFVFGVVGKVEEEPLGLQAAADRFADEASCLHHLVSTETVEVCEGNFPHQLVIGLFRLQPRGFDVVQVDKELVAILLILFRQMPHAFGGLDDSFRFAIHVDAKLPLQNFSNRVFQKAAALGDDVAEGVALGLVQPGFS